MLTIDAKIAAQRARDYFIDLMGLEPKYITLEEVELSEDEKYWFITLGYQEHEGPFSSFIKKYKIFKVSAVDGTVASMKIREISKV